MADNANDSEMNRMQQDAIRRVREMQARAMQYQSGGQPEPRRADPPSQPSTQRQQPQQNASNPRNPQQGRETPGAQPRRENSQRQEPHAPQSAAHNGQARPPQQEPHAASNHPEHAAPAAQTPAPPIQQQLEPPMPAQTGNPVTDIFQMLFRESDRTLILALILVLSEEKTEPGLLFALLYIAL